MPLARVVVGDRVDAVRWYPERERQIDGAVADGVERDGDPVGRGSAEVVGEAVPVGEGLDAESAQQCVVARGGRAEHACSPQHAELGGEDADSARGTTDQHHVVRGDALGLHARDGGAPRDVQGAGFEEGQAVGDANELAGIDHEVVCLRVVPQSAEDGVPDPPAVHIGAEPLDGAGEVVAVAGGEPALVGIAHREAAEQLPVHRVHSGGRDAHEHLVVCRPGDRTMLDLEHLGAAEPAEHHTSRCGVRRIRCHGASLGAEDRRGVSRRVRPWWARPARPAW